MTHCIRHYEEPFMGNCKTCGRPFCNRCLVFPFGDDKPPYCVSCAIAASGVRSGTKVVPLAKVKPERTTWSQRAEARATKRALKKAERQQKPILDDQPRSTQVPVPKGLPTPASRFRRTKAEAAEEPATTVD